MIFNYKYESIHHSENNLKLDIELYLFLNFLNDFFDVTYDSKMSEKNLVCEENQISEGDFYGHTLYKFRSESY